MTRFRALIASMVLCVTSMAAAQNSLNGELSVDDAWARPLPSVSVNGAAYLRIVNHTMHSDRLLAADSPVAERVEFHAHVHSGSMMMMQQLNELPIAAHDSLTMVPGGTHLMLVGLKKPLTAGDTFALTLTFEQAGKTEVTVQVEARTSATTMPAMKHSAAPPQHGKKR